MSVEEKIEQEATLEGESLKNEAATVDSSALEISNLREENAAQAKKIIELSGKIAFFEDKVSGFRDYVKKLEGEIEAIRERSRRDSDRAVDQKMTPLFLEILEILDNFDLSLKGVGDRDDQLIKGLLLVRQRFIDALSKCEVTRIHVIGETFDPQRHEAIVMRPTALEKEDGIICEEIRAGYSYKQNILRPAQVMVGRFEQGA